MERVLVTGGAGFIGSNIVRSLLEDGHPVRVIDNFATGRRQNLEGVLDDIELIEGDLQSYERAHNAVRGCDVILHQAALPSVPRSVQDPLTTNAVNVTGALNVLLCARDEGVRRVVFASSSSIYGDSMVNPRSEAQSPAPMSPYAVSKLAGEQYCKAFCEVYDVQTVALRYFNVFGPRQDPHSQYSAAIPRFIRALRGSARPVVYGDGQQTRDFTFVEDVVRANVAAMRAEVDGHESINVARGCGVTVLELIDRLADILGVEYQVAHEAPRPGDVRASVADVSLARRVLGWEPSVDLTEGLRVTVAWLIEREGGVA